MEHSDSLNHVSKSRNTWWDQNREQVEGKLIDLLISSDNRAPYAGPERRSIATLTLDPQDAAIARDQARLAGMLFEEYARRLFHDAVKAEQARLSAEASESGSKLGPCKVELWRSTSAKSA
jgi:hypothetical protein